MINYAVQNKALIEIKKYHKTKAVFRDNLAVTYLGRVVRLEVLLGALGVGLDGVGTGGPGGGAGLSHVAVGPLEGLQQAQSLLHGTPHLVIVDLHRTDGSRRVYRMLNKIKLENI